MSVFFPDLVVGTGKDVWTFVPAISARSAMTVAEVSATGACNVQNAMRPGFGVSSETERVNDERQGASKVRQINGQTTQSFPDMIVIDRPQDATGTASRKHLDVLAAGAVGYLVNRRGLGSSSENWVAWAAGQKYIGYPVEVGIQNPNAVGDSKAFEKSISFSITGDSFEGSVAA